MKTSTAKILLAILMATMPFAVVGWKLIDEDGALAPDLIGEVEKGAERNLGGARQATSNIVEIAVGASPEFETLVAAVTAAGLVEALSGPGPFTVFGEIVYLLVFRHFSTNPLNLLLFRLSRIQPRPTQLSLRSLLVRLSLFSSPTVLVLYRIFSSTTLFPGSIRNVTSGAAQVP